MKLIRHRRTFTVILAGIFFATPVISSPLLYRDAEVVNTLFAQTKPQCIGRYVIDVPQSFNNQLRDMIFIDDFKIESKPLYPLRTPGRYSIKYESVLNALQRGPEGERSESIRTLRDRSAIRVQTGCDNNAYWDRL